MRRAGIPEKLWLCLDCTGDHRFIDDEESAFRHVKDDEHRVCEYQFLAERFARPTGPVSSAHEFATSTGAAAPTIPLGEILADIRDADEAAWYRELNEDGGRGNGR